MKISLEDVILFKTLGFFKSLDRRVLAIILFGSYIYSLRNSRDIDVVLIVDSLADLRDKITLEAEIARSLSRECKRKVDIQVFDLESFRENLTIGTLLSGLILGYRIVYDEVGVGESIREFIKAASKEPEYTYVKRKKWKLTAIARVKSYKA